MSTVVLTAKQISQIGLIKLMNAGVQEIKPINGAPISVGKFLGVNKGTIIVQNEKGKRRICGKKSIETITVSAAVAAAVHAAA